MIISNHTNVICIGDAFVDAHDMEKAILSSKIESPLVKKINWEMDKLRFTQRQLHIEKNGPDAEAPPDQLLGVIADCEVLFTHFCPISSNLIDHASNLKLILSCRGGYEHIDLKRAEQKKIKVINVVRNAQAVSEFTLGLALSLSRNIVYSDRKIHEGKWIKNFNNSDSCNCLSSLTIGIIGLGNVGVEVAKRFHMLGSKIIAFDPFVDDKKLKEAGLSNFQLTSNIEDVFIHGDIVSLHQRLNDENRGSINFDLFKKMKPTSYFINTARAGLINEEDLYYVLKKGLIMGAAVDVFQEEPIKKNHPFLSLDNIILCPHIAGDTIDSIKLSPYKLIPKINEYVESEWY